MTIGGYRVGPLLKRTGHEILDDNVLGLSAQTAYYFFFSLFPLLLFLAPILALVGDKERRLHMILDRAAGVVPPESMELLRKTLRNVVETDSAPGLMSVGALLALWAGSNIFNNLIGAMNRAYDLEDGRPWWKKRLIAIAAVIIAGIIVTTATVVLIWGEQLVTWAAGLLGIGGAGQTIWLVLQYALVFALLVGLAWGIYYYFPAVKGQSAKQVLVAAVVATVLWIAVTLAFRFYVQNFGNYNATYGAIGSVIVLLTWMYLTMLVVLSGGELASELHNGTGAVTPQRGSTFSGRIGTGRRGTPSTERVGRVEPMAARGSE